jgi:hypothetical protein
MNLLGRLDASIPLGDEGRLLLDSVRALARGQPTNPLHLSTVAIHDKRLSSLVKIQPLQLVKIQTAPTTG